MFDRIAEWDPYEMATAAICVGLIVGWVAAALYERRQRRARVSDPHPDCKRDWQRDHDRQRPVPR